MPPRHLCLLLLPLTLFTFGAQADEVNYGSQAAPPPEPGRIVLTGPSGPPPPGQPYFTRPSVSPPIPPGRPYWTGPSSPPAPQPQPLPQPPPPPQPNPSFTKYYTGAPRVIWSCNWDANMCHLKNRFNFVQFERGVYQYQRAMVLDINRAAQNRSSLPGRPNPVYSYNAARLVATEYFPAEYSNACLYLSHLWSGTGDKRMHVMQRNTEDRCIYSQHSYAGEESTAQPAWRDLEIQLDLTAGPSAFLIEYVFDIPERRSNLGTIALRNFTIAYGNCRRNDGVECDLPI